MTRPSIVFAIGLTAIAPAWSDAHAQVTETYVFRDSMLPNEGVGPALEAVYNGTGTIVTAGADFVNGAYVTESISTSACASSPSVRAWSFPVSGGLRHANSAPTVITGSYSISMLLRYDPMDSGYARLIDFSDSTSDNGIYKLNDGVSFYPVGTFAAGSFVQGQDVFVTITREASTQLVSLFINGAAAGTYTDSGGLYAPAATVMYFLMDNTTGSAAIHETDPGVIAYLQIRDTPMTAEEVVASLAAICATVACGDGLVTSGEACDDGGVVGGDGCSASCTIETGWVCTGAPSVCVAVDAGRADAGAIDRGLHEAGTTDRGIADTGRLDTGGQPDSPGADVGHRVDGAAAGGDTRRADVSTTPPDAADGTEPTDAGCGCALVDLRPAPLGVGVASILVLGFLAARRVRQRE